MSVIAWMFGLGILAVGFPFLFHMVRRTPKGLMPFGSVMFLKPSPPVVTRRSRLENLLLLALRAAAICLIVSAFMRPFFRGADTLSEVDVANRRVAILVDFSASMRRTGLWDQATQQVEQVLESLEPNDDVALLAFDSSVRSIVDFDESVDDRDATRRIRESLKTLEPTWARSDLGMALVSVADQLDIWRESQRSNDEHSDSKLQIVVISDLQKGSRLEALQAYQWPANVFVKFLTVVPEDFSNATLQLLDPLPDENDPSTRIRVANSEDSIRDQFFVHWEGEPDRPPPASIPFYVPAGTSQVLKVPLDQTRVARQFVVSGDEEEFDNDFFVVPPQPYELKVIYVGPDDNNDPQGLLFYLDRALSGGSVRTVSVSRLEGDSTLGQPTEKGGVPTLVVLATAVEESRKPDIDAYLKSGGTLLVVLRDDETTQSTASWTGAKTVADAAREGQPSSQDYRMLADIRFSNPLFHPFANPKFNDFTQIRFWRYQPVELGDDVDVLARFDNGASAIWHRTLPEGGEVYSLASGWHPDDSQLALSTKFVPLINGLLDIAADLPDLKKSLLVGEPIVFPASKNSSEKRIIVKPDGTRVELAQSDDRFNGTDEPGIYRYLLEDLNTDLSPTDESEPPVEFAVNVDRAESETIAIPLAQIEMNGVKIGEQETAAAELSQMRDQRDRDIEDRQKFWKWLIIGAMMLLISETWLASRTASRTDVGSAPSPLSREPSGEMI